MPLLHLHLRIEDRGVRMEAGGPRTEEIFFEHLHWIWLRRGRDTAGESSRERKKENGNVINTPLCSLLLSQRGTEDESVEKMITIKCQRLAADKMYEEAEIEVPAPEFKKLEG